jgi:NAD(P)-dependent dehydrogenase (short-subunit alcohol dehydrogenase family)
MIIHNSGSGWSIDPMSAVLIIGGSRGIGLETVKLALKPVIRYARWRGQRAQYACAIPSLRNWTGDALDQHTIERALARVDAVIQTLGVSPTPELIFGGTRLFSVATRAMEASAVRRLLASPASEPGKAVAVEDFLQCCSPPDPSAGYAESSGRVRVFKSAEFFGFQWATTGTV